MSTVLAIGNSTSVEDPSGKTASSAIRSFLTSISNENASQTVENILHEFKEVDKFNRNGTVEAFLAHPELNRYKGVFLLDETRVIIKDPIEHDYIHASHINLAGLNLIMSQGPMNNTAADFLQMVFENDAKVIVQLCNFTENGREKSFYYLQNATYGNLSVAVIGTREMTPSLWRTTLNISRDGLTKTVEHVNFIGWRDFSVPTEMEVFPLILYFMETHGEGAPVVIHCTAGVGRTGSFVSSLVAYRTFAQGRSLAVADVVKDVRRQRMHSVETSMQYLFVYRCTLELLMDAYPSVYTPSLTSFLAEYDRRAAVHVVPEEHANSRRKRLAFSMRLNSF
ncbi:Protein-tyrosine phosphatase containing protein [Aphelenchoides avenae]|nr:Protein-tyrosine phosphatase containing protein [Aphelenchus avenae]